MSKVDRRIENTRNNFERFVWPEVRDLLAPNSQYVDLIPTEGVDDNLRNAFDTISGVDFWAVKSGNEMVSIASRVQPGHEFPTFTVRYELESGNDTEHQKRMKQYHSKLSHLPTYTVQAYIDPTIEALQNFAFVETKQLYDYISRELCPIGKDEVVERRGEANFYAVEWSELVGCTDIVIYDKGRADIDSNISKDASLTDWL